MKKYILYNPLAGNEKSTLDATKLDALYIGHELVYKDILGIENYEEFFANLAPDDEIIICGGDGTLNNFINNLGDTKIKNNLYYYATGSGNDFLRDLEKPRGSEPFLINEYIKTLPTVEISGEEKKFFNGVGYGLDGAVCATGNALRKKTKKPINYTALALRLILFSFRPRAAKVTVDGVTYEHKRVWLSTAMLGRFFGGGMMIAPAQARDGDELSLVVAHNCGRFKLLTVFPSIFSGQHIKYKKQICIYTGKEITVEYNTPCEMQIDGETYLNVKRYTARAASFITTENSAEPETEFEEIELGAVPVTVPETKPESEENFSPTQLGFF